MIDPIKRLLLLVAGVLVIAGSLSGTMAKGAVEGGGSGGYRYAFPAPGPSLATVRTMMLHNCVVVTYPNVWVCPDAPPYTYGS